MLAGILGQRLENSYSASEGERRMSLAAITGKLEALSPLAVLSRGYGAVFSEEGTVVKNAADVSCGDTVTVRMHDGRIKASVRDVSFDLTEEV